MSAGTYDAEPAPVTRCHRFNVRGRLWRSLCAGAFRATEAARDDRVDPARQILQESLRPGRWFAKSLAQRPRDRMPASRGIPTSGWSRSISTCWRPSAAPEQTRSPPMAATLRIFRPISKPPAAPSPRRAPTICAAISANCRGAACGSTTVARRLSAIRQLYRFLYAEGQRSDDPAAVLEGPKRERALPKTLTLAEVDHLLARRRQHRSGGAVAGAAARGAARLPGRNALRHRAARLRTGGVAAIGGPPRRARHRGARQGQQGAAGAAQRRGQARDGGLSRSARGIRRRAPDRNGCSRRSAKAAISPASISRAN